MRNKSPSLELSSPLTGLLSTHRRFKAKFGQSVRPAIPKIANREIPLHSHHYGVTQRENQNETDFSLWQSLEKTRKKSNCKPKHTVCYDRTVRLLKQYLIRKEKLLFAPLSCRNPELCLSPEHTVNEFRIKKEKRGRSGDAAEPSSLMGYNEVNEHKKERYKFIPNKSLYQMTSKELADSIQLKRDFLELISKRIHESRRNLHSRPSMVQERSIPK